MKRFLLAPWLLLGPGIGCAPRVTRGPQISWSELRQDVRLPRYFQGQGEGLYRTGDRTWKLRFAIRWDPDTVRWLVRGWLGVARKGNLPWTVLLPGGAPDRPLPVDLHPDRLSRAGSEIEALLKVRGHALTLRFSSRGTLVAARVPEGELRILDRVEGPEGWVPRRAHRIGARGHLPGQLRRW
ncbi:MAG: hypothetical protein L3J76_05545, partial [Candidatus Hydrothermae bacterium]|nr:hypothetical protein [Candidatus Hydrothermae bacterium]